MPRALLPGRGPKGSRAAGGDIPLPHPSLPGPNGADRAAGCGAVGRCRRERPCPGEGRPALAQGGRELSPVGARPVAGSRGALQGHLP